MSNVLIKGMEMPENCYDCKFECENLCCVIGRRTESLDRPDWCPLVEVPTPHGRLVDADEIVRYANGEITGVFAYPQGARQDDEKRYRESWDFVRTMVIAAPTVIETEA